MQKDANLAELEKCCQTHICLAKFRFDTAENEPAKNLQNFRKMHFSKMRQGAAGVHGAGLRVQRGRGGRAGGRRRRGQRASVGKISAKCCSFSAVSALIFARKYAFCSIFQNLPDSQAEIFEI